MKKSNKKHTIVYLIYHYDSILNLLPVLVLLTIILLSILLISSVTCDITPINLSLLERSVKIFSAWFNDSVSNEPNPSSINNESILIPPWVLLMVSLNPNAKASDALNFSPPDNDATSRSLPVYESNIEKSKKH